MQSPVPMPNPAGGAATAEPRGRPAEAATAPAEPRSERRSRGVGVAFALLLVLFAYLLAWGAGFVLPHQFLHFLLDLRPADPEGAFRTLRAIQIGLLVARIVLGLLGIVLSVAVFVRGRALLKVAGGASALTLVGSLVLSVAYGVGPFVLDGLGRGMLETAWLLGFIATLALAFAAVVAILLLVIGVVLGLIGGKR